MSIAITNPSATLANSGVAVTEGDGAPLVNDVSTMKFPNGSVTDNGDGTVSLATGSGTGIGDVSGSTASIDGEAVLFSGTSGKSIKRSVLSGTAKSILVHLP